MCLWWQLSWNFGSRSRRKLPWSTGSPFCRWLLRAREWSCRSPNNIMVVTFILTDRFSPDAKNPPKGPIVLANKEKIMKWPWSLVMLKGPKFRRSIMGDTQEVNVKGMKLRVVWGQSVPVMVCMASVSYISRIGTMMLKRQVLMAPPIYPSHVFLGESAMSWCLPKK